MKTELFRTELYVATMGETLSIPIIPEIKSILKRVRPLEWIVEMPPVKRIKIFHDSGAKAPFLDNLVGLD